MLLQPLHLGPRQAPNRVVFGPHETNLGWGRTISERHVAYYQRRAAGGAGVIVTEEASVHPSDWPYERAPLAAECAPGWAAVAAACRPHGPLVLAALGHAGGQGSSAYSQSPTWGPSRVPDVTTREVPKWMEQADIDAVVGGFADAAATAIDAGLDGIEINAGQHSLLRQFASGLTNQRGDAYGEDRARLILDVLAAVREGIGRDHVVGVRLSCDELAPWAGLTPAAGAELALRLAPSADYLTVLRGSIYSAAATRPDTHAEPGFNIELARAVRAAVAGQAAVIVQGSMVDVDQAAYAVESGAADAVEMSRAQIAEPDLVAKLAADDVGRIRPCILCNQTCQVRDNRNPIVTCVSEPSAGHETEDEPVFRATHPSRLSLLVIGAGVAGLECARVAALAGHRVRVVDRAASAGGMLRVAAAGAGRARLGRLADWLERECATLGVAVECGVTVGPAEIAEHAGPTVLCTGSRPGPRPYAVDRDAMALDAVALLSGAAVPDGAVAVWDPIGGPIAVSVAERLAAEGRSVVLVTPDILVGTLLSRSGDLAPANVRLQQAGVTLERRADLLSVTAEGIEVRDRFSAVTRTIPTAAVVDCGARLPDDELWRRTGERLPRAGDAVAPRTAYEAVLEGRRVAQSLAAIDVGGVPA